MYSDYYRPLGLEHSLMVCLPKALPGTARPGRYVRLHFLRGPGPDFSERDRAVLTLLGPHLDHAYLDAQRRRHPVPGSLPGRRTCCTWYPPGTPTPRSPGGWAYPAHPPGEHLRTAARLQPHRRRHPRLPRPGRLGLTGGRGNVSWPSALALAGLIPWASGRRVRPMACDARRTAWTWQP
jgi:hypothetical protein